MKHLEQKEDEIYMGNSDGFPSFLSWKTKRVGKIAYDKNGKIIKNPCGLIPWFVNKKEILKAGFKPNNINSKFEISGYTSKWFRENVEKVLIKIKTNIIMLTKKITREEQQKILNTLFGFDFVDVGNNHFVLYDEEGNEFYGRNSNGIFDFSTLAGIFSYTASRAKKQGMADKEHEIKKALNIT